MSAVVPRPLSLWGVAGPVGIVALSRSEASSCCEAWEHPLGGCDRPFGQDQWGLVVNESLIGVAVTASTVSPTVTDKTGTVWQRNTVAELARISVDPAHRWAGRPLLRLWREVLVHHWGHWPVQLAVSYAVPGTVGNIYRFDGWEKVREVKKASPGKSSTWANPSAADAIADGIKTLWSYRYPASHFGGNPQ